MFVDVNFKATLWTKNLLEGEFRSISLHEKYPFMEICSMSGPKLVLPSLFCMLNSTFVARTKKSLSCTERAVPYEFDYIF